jgi:hypothetical protein
MMKGLQHKLAGVGRTDDKLDSEVAKLDTLVREWAEADAAKSPKGKRPAALNVMRQ